MKTYKKVKIKGTCQPTKGHEGPESGGIAVLFL